MSWTGGYDPRRTYPGAAGPPGHPTASAPALSPPLDGSSSESRPFLVVIEGATPSSRLRYDAASDLVLCTVDAPSSSRALNGCILLKEEFGFPRPTNQVTVFARALDPTSSAHVPWSEVGRIANAERSLFFQAEASRFGGRPFQVWIGFRREGGWPVRTEPLPVAAPAPAPAPSYHGPATSSHTPSYATGPAAHSAAPAHAHAHASHPPPGAALGGGARLGAHDDPTRPASAARSPASPYDRYSAGGAPTPVSAVPASTAAPASDGGFAPSLSRTTTAPAATSDPGLGRTHVHAHGYGHAHAHAHAAPPSPSAPAPAYEGGASAAPTTPTSLVFPADADEASAPALMQAHLLAVVTRIKQDFPQPPKREDGITLRDNFAAVDSANQALEQLTVQLNAALEDLQRSATRKSWSERTIDEAVRLARVVVDDFVGHIQIEFLDPVKTTDEDLRRLRKDQVTRANAIVERLSHFRAHSSHRFHGR